MSDPTFDWGDVPARGSDANFLADSLDDDAVIIDSLVSQDATPPEAPELPTEVRNVPRATHRTPPQTRTVLRTIVIADFGIGNLLMPNKFRTLARISASQSVTGTIAHDRGTVEAVANTLSAQTGGDFARIGFSSVTDFEWSGNGELWVKSHASGNVYWTVVEEITLEENR